MQVYQPWQDVTRNWRGCQLDEAALPTNPPPPTTLRAKVQAVSKKVLALTTFVFFFSDIYCTLFCVCEHSTAPKWRSGDHLQSWFSPTLWTPEIELRLSDLVASSFFLPNTEPSWRPPTLYFWKLPGTFDPFSGKRTTRAKDCSSRWTFSWSRVCFAPCSNTGTTWKIHQDIRSKALH